MASNPYVPNIYIIGPQSTGKTTLVNELQADLEHGLVDSSIDKPQIVSEVARSVLAKHKYSAEDIRTSKVRCLELQQLILQAQAEAEKEALKTSSWFISDRAGFDPLVYAKRYASPGAEKELQQLETWKQVKARMETSLIVVCEAGTPWLMDDGVRLMPGSETEWMQVFDDFCQILNIDAAGCASWRTALAFAFIAWFLHLLSGILGVYVLQTYIKLDETKTDLKQHAEKLARGDPKVHGYQRNDEATDNV